MIENADWVINHYREMTISLDYYGDSVINSAVDILFMVLGFFLAAWWPVWLTILVGIALELIVGAMIRDNPERADVPLAARLRPTLATGK